MCVYLHCLGVEEGQAQGAVLRRKRAILDDSDEEADAEAEAQVDADVVGKVSAVAMPTTKRSRLAALDSDSD